jgi:hypothetical protein
VHVNDDGSLTADGRPLRGPLLAETYGSAVLLQDAHVVGRGPTSALWIPNSSRRPRLRLYALGRYSDGWLARAGVVYVWPRTAGERMSGWLSMRLTAPPVVGAVTLSFVLANGARSTVTVRPGEPQTIRVPMCGAKNAHVTYLSKTLAFVGLRAVSVKASPPVFTPSRFACTSGIRQAVLLSSRNVF